MDFTRKSIIDAIRSNDIDELKAILLNKPIDFDINGIIMGNPSLTALHLAVDYSNIGLVSLLLQNGADPCLKTNEGNTCLHLATAAGVVDLVELLLPTADIDAVNNLEHTALHVAVEIQQYDVVKLLLLNNANIDTCDSHGNTPFFASLARRNYNKKISNYLLSYGVNLELKNKMGLNALQIAVTNGACEIVDRLLKMGLDINVLTESRETLLHLAVKHRTNVMALINCGIDIHAADKLGMTALDYAFELKAVDQHKKVIECLLSRGGKFDCRGKRVSIHDLLENSDRESLRHLMELIKKSLFYYKDTTYLFVAVCFNDVKLRDRILKVFFETLKDVNLYDFYDDFSLIHWSISSKDLQLCKMLINFGCNIEARSDDQCTPLMAAVEVNFYEGAKVLIESGAVVEDHDGSDSIVLTAITNNNMEMTNLLLNNKANVNDYSFWARVGLFWEEGCALPAIDELIKHIASHTSLDQSCLNEIRSRPDMWSRYLFYEKIIEEMKTTKVCAAFRTTYADVLKSPYTLINCLRYKEVDDWWKLKKYTGLFGIYSQDLRTRYLEASKRLQNIVKFEEVLGEIFIGLFPANVIRSIGQFYNDKEFVACM